MMMHLGSRDRDVKMIPEAGLRGARESRNHNVCEELYLAVEGIPAPADRAIQRNPRPRRKI